MAGRGAGRPTTFLLTLSCSIATKIRIPIRFVFSVKDASNPDHETYQDKLLRIYDNLRDKSKAVMLQWSEKDKLRKYLSVASYGLSVNLDTIEGYLSSRVRLRDYVSYRLPVITTGENAFYEENSEICVLAEPKKDHSSICSMKLN